MSLLTSFFQAVKHTFEGNDGKISSRKTTAFLFVLLIVANHLVIYYCAAFKAEYMLLIYTMLIDLGALSVLFGYTTVSAIMELLHRRNKPENPEL